MEIVNLYEMDNSQMYFADKAMILKLRDKTISSLAASLQLENVLNIGKCWLIVLARK